MDARYAAMDYKIDLFARVDKGQVAGMVYRHLRWRKGDSDNLVSWTSLLLLVYVFHLHANTSDRSTFGNIHLCIMDTTCFPKGVFLQDMDLIRAYRSFDSELENFEDLRSKKYRYLSGYFYFGEYLS